MNENNIMEISKNDNIGDIVQPMLRMLHISHLDLDGYGATFLSEFISRFFPEGAMTLETMNILPNKLNVEIENVLTQIDNYDLVVITDLAVNTTLVELLKDNPNRNKIRIFDHHLCDISDIPDNILVSMNSPIYKNKLTCATELYYNFIKNDRVFGLIQDPKVKEAIAYFVECVRVYDTFEFWNSRNDNPNEIYRSYFDAPRLNTLFHIMDRNEFKDYIFSYLTGESTIDTITTSSERYPWVSKILELEQNKNKKYADSALRRLVKTPFKYTICKDNNIIEINYTAGIVFAEKSSPVIANTALELYADIDFCAVVSNNQVSIYSNKDSVDASRIAKIFGGGGHKEAAGFTIPYANSANFNLQHFASILECAANLAPNTVIFPCVDVTDTN